MSQHSDPLDQIVDRIREQGVWVIELPAVEHVWESLREDLLDAVGKQISAGLTREQLVEFDRIERDDAAAAQFLETNVPGFRESTRAIVSAFIDRVVSQYVRYAKHMAERLPVTR